MTNTLPYDSEYLSRINYGKPTSHDFQILDQRLKLFGLSSIESRNQLWESIVDSAMLTDLFHALYGEKKWAETKMYTESHGKYMNDLRYTALALDRYEKNIVDTLACQLVYDAYQAAELQKPDSETEPLVALFDLAINFIIFLAIELHEADSSLTTAVFTKFRETHPAYEQGKGLIFQSDSTQAQQFLMTTYRFGAACDTDKQYFGGNQLYLYVGPRRTFGKPRERPLREEVLKTLGLRALIKESAKAVATGPLDELTASYIHSGPFKLKMSDQIQDHLTFRLDGTIVIYDCNQFDYLALFRSHVAEYLLSCLSLT